MGRQNMGVVDRTIRVAAGAVLVLVGLFALGGLQGGLIGILVVAVSLLLLGTGVTGVCPGYMPFGISTIGGLRKPERG
jgi:hypothetical protein